MSNNPVYLKDLTWLEAQEAFKTVDFCILPCGAMEQHGHHLPIATDSLITGALIDKVVERMKGKLRLLVLPLLMYGNSPEHSSFPGTVFLSGKTLTRIIVEISRSLAIHDVGRILLLNGHGGNTNTLRSALRDIREKEGIEPYLFEMYESATARRFAPELDYHAGEVETSIMLYLYPEKVKTECFPKTWEYSALDLAKTRLNVPWRSEEFSSIGVIGDPRGASAEKGREIVESWLEELFELLTSVVN